MKLYLKLYLAFCITLLLATVIMASFLFQINEINEKSQWEAFLKERVNSLSELFVNNLENDGWNNDKERASSLSAERIGRWIGGKVWILDSTQKVIGSNTNLPKPVLDEQHYFQIQNSQFSKNDNSWIAKIDLSKKEISIIISINKPDRKGPHVFFGIVLSILLGFIILLFPLRFLLGKPLREIKDTAFEIAQGNLNRRAVINTKDELKKVADTINLMADQIQRVLQNSIDVNAHVSHELRSPISRMRLILELLLDEMKQIQPNFKKRTEELTLEIERLDELVGAVLQLSKFNLKDGKYQPTDLSAQLVQIMKEREEFILERNIKVKATIDPALKVNLDPVWSESILKNLIDNSLLYGDLKQEIKIELKILENNFYFIIENSILDEDENPEKWFLPFVRGNNEISAQNKDGLGLGLAISRSAAERMGGSLTVTKKNTWIQFTWTQALKVKVV
ncbi:MAG: HAMP domain-containing histidine kinase [Leptospiraceae bacterium]|nr:HAMP domain-containing histidine kinase [Leptospiraceae bacterium]